MKKIQIVSLLLSVLLIYSTAIAELNNGLVAFYPFNGNADDESKNGNDGIVNGAILTEDRHGNPDTAYSFDGVDDYIKVDGSQFNFTENMTLSIWLKPSTNQLNYACIIDKSHTHTSNEGLLKGFNLQQAGNENNAYVFHYLCGETSCVYNIKNSIKVGADEWSHIIITAELKTGNIEYYLNGTLLSEYQQPYSIVTNGNLPLIIGNANNSNRYFKGLIDDIRIYNRIISDIEIQQLSEKKVIQVGESLVQNGNFENSSSWNSDWKIVEFTSGSKIESIIESDNTYIKLHHDTESDWCGIGQEIASKLEKGAKYIFSYKYKTSDSVAIGIHFSDINLIMHGSKINNEYGWNHSLIADNSWHTDSLEFTVTDDHPKSDEPMLGILFDYKYTGDIYIDDISLKKAEDESPKDIIDIPIDYLSWNKVGCGSVETTTEGTKLNATGYRNGNRLFYSKMLFNFLDSELFIKWKAFGGGQYAAYCVGINGVVSFYSATHHSYSFYKHILEDTWYYTRIKINNDYSYEVVTSNNDYDTMGGTIFDQSTGILENDRHVKLKKTNLYVDLVDNYAGTKAYLIVSEIKTNANIIPIESMPNDTYNFDNDAAIPNAFSLTGNWSINDIGYNSSKSLHVETNKSSSAILNVLNAIAISFKYKATDTNTTNTFNFLIDDKVKFKGGFGTNEELCWREFIIPFLDGSHKLEWKIEGTNSVWIDDIVIYKSDKNADSYQIGYSDGYLVGKAECENMFSQDQLDQAVKEAESKKDVMISDLNVKINTMYTQEQFNQAIENANRGFYSNEDVDLMINKILEWDANNDGTIGLIEAIQALKTSTGIKPIE